MEFPVPKGHERSEFPTPQEAEESGLNPCIPSPPSHSDQPPLSDLTHKKRRWSFKTEHLEWKLLGVLCGIAYLAGYSARHYK